MNGAIRWRIVSLQAVMVMVLAAVGGFLLYESNFAKTFVTDELTAQNISFPTADQVKLGGALDPTVYKPEIVAQAGNKVDTGDRARIYANDYIAVHMKSAAAGLTYSQISGLARSQPKNTVLQGQLDTIFKGDMLRGTLLNSYGWWTVGSYAGYAAYGLFAAAAIVLAALVFELYIAASRKPEYIQVAQKKAA
jgi:hypothetical protein